MKIHDISIPITPAMPTFPGDPPVRVTPEKQITQGDAANVSHLSLGNHTGTHVDPPVHFVPGGKTVDQLDLRALVGPARVVDLTRVERTITASDLARARIPRRTKRVLFKTRNSMLWERANFQTDFVALAPDAAQWLIGRGVQLVGIDYLSIEAFDAREPQTHRLLLGAGIVIVEGLNLRAIAPGAYSLVCLPLKIAGGDGAPARAVLIES